MALQSINDKNKSNEKLKSYTLLMIQCFVYRWLDQLSLYPTDLTFSPYFWRELTFAHTFAHCPWYSGSHCNQGQWAPVDTQTPFKISLGEMVKCLIYYMIIDLTSPNMFSPTTQQWECLYLFSSANGSNNWKGRKLFYSLLIILPEIYFHNNSIYSGS